MNVVIVVVIAVAVWNVTQLVSNADVLEAAGDADLGTVQATLETIGIQAETGR